MREFAEEWEGQAAERNVALRVRVQEGDLSVSVDPNQLRRVLVNLVDNALDAIAGDGEEAAERSKAGVITLAVRPMRRMVKITVRDNGPGIPDDIREHVLEPFFTSKAQGSGLGLYLVREIVLAHGGALFLSSNGGRGTAVTTRWPRPQNGSS
ncbi:MAG: sensor histidine kinase [Planctomycetota bacterium]